MACEFGVPDACHPGDPYHPCQHKRNRRSYFHLHSDGETCGMDVLDEIPNSTRVELQNETMDVPLELRTTCG